MPLSGNSFLYLYQEIHFYTYIRKSILFFRFSHFSFFMNLLSTDLFLFNKVKTTLLKTPHILAAGRRELNLNPTWKLLSCWLDFTVLERIYRQLGKKRHQRAYPALYPARYSNNLPGELKPLVS